MKRIAWGSDPFSLGSYSHTPPLSLDRPRCAHLRTARRAATRCERTPEESRCSSEPAWKPEIFFCCTISEGSLRI